MKRLIAMLAASLVIVLLIANLSFSGGRRTDGLYYKATGIHPDAQLMEVDRQTVTAEEYLYWLAYDSEYLNANLNGQVDWNASINEDVSFGEYAKMDAENTVKLYAVTRAWAKESGLTLTEEDDAALDQQYQQYVTYYGGEDAWLRQLELMGITQETLRGIESVPYLYAHLYEEFTGEGGSLRPDDTKLDTFGAEQNYVTARLLYFATTGMDDQGRADVKEKAESYAEKMQSADDRDAVYEELAAELDLDTDPAGLTFSPAHSDPAVCEAVAKLEEGQVSGVIEGANGYYVALRMPLDREALLPDLFTEQLRLRQDGAKIRLNRSLYNKIDTGEFYSRLNEERMALLDDSMAQVPSLQPQPEG